MRYGIAKTIARAIADLPEEQRSEWAELYQEHRGDPFLLRAAWTPEQRLAVRLAISSWMRCTSDVCLAVKSVSNWSPRFGAALALQAVISTVDLWPDSSHLGHQMIEAAAELLWSRSPSESVARECSFLVAECRHIQYSGIRNRNSFSSFWCLGTAMEQLSASKLKAKHPPMIVDCMCSCAASMADLRWGSTCAPYDSEWVAEREMQIRRLGAILAEALLTGNIAERLG